MELFNYEKEHLRRCRALAPECMVLLKKNGDFPLNTPGKIALYGSGARRTAKGGTGSGDVNSRYVTTIEKGLENAGFTVTTKAWLEGYEREWQKGRQAFVAGIRRQAKEQRTQAVFLGMGAAMPEPDYELPLQGAGDTAVYVLSRISGEGSDRKLQRGDFCLTGTEVRDILACQKRYRRFLLVLNVCGAVDLTPVLAVENILLLSQLGAVTGDAFADVLLGKACPSGKLTAAWACADDVGAIREFGGCNDTRYHEGIYVGYRYYDSAGKTLLFPFGYGLGYTEFAVSKVKTALSGTAVTVSATVQNCGRYPGKEVLQLYVTAPWGELDQPYRRLAGFAKTRELAPGEACEAAVVFRMEQLASFDAKKCASVLEQGDYILRLGDTPCAVLALPETVYLRELGHIGGKDQPADFKPEHTWQNEALPEIPHLLLDPAALKAIVWPAPAAMDEMTMRFVSGLSDEQLVHLVIGAAHEGSALASVIGSVSGSVAGAAGESYAGVPGVPKIVMADGPAGLRLSQHYTKDEKGVHPIGDTMPAGMIELLPPIAQWGMRLLFGKTPKGTVRDQYCTAIPTGTALAQSWNEAVWEACGDIVGEEMERFGVHLWLAPAFNIHRSPLCGRNFEYCSEDPLLSGLVGAGITKGVQKHPGKGVTIKHFCANNQETNRFQSNSIVSERALREIYLKPFEICIREANPAALMTSYNLLNGTHTSERADLLKGFLREELGWNGLIMSDWVVGGAGRRGSAHRMAKAAPSVKAGNDLFMPGSKANYRDVLTALRGNHKETALTRAELEYCAAHIVQTARQYGML